VPKSRVRKRTVYTPPPAENGAPEGQCAMGRPGHRACLIIGLAWIVTY